MKYGLPAATIDKIQAVLARFPRVERALLYGSRAKGNFKPGSDIDLTLCGENLDCSQLGTIAEALDDLLLPYTLDLSLYAELNHAKLRDHIDRVGVVFYERSTGQHQGSALKKGWVNTKLEDVCGFQNGFAFKSNTFKPTGVPIVRISNIRDGCIDLDNRLVFFDPKDYAINLDRYRIVEDDLLIAMSGATTGKIGFNTKGTVFYLNQRVGKFEPGANLNKRFLYHFLSLNVEENLRISAGAAQPNLSTEQIKGFTIPLPPLAEQQRIVGLLEEAFEDLATAKANAEKNLQNARALFESHLQSVFTQRGPGWVEKPLREICAFSQGVQVDVKHQSDIRKGQSQVRFLRIVDFTQGNEPERFIDNPGEKFLVRQSDVSLVRYGASTGFVCRGLEGAIANNLFRVIPKDGHVSNDFLYWFLKSPAFQDEIKEIMNGAAMPAISFGMINEIAVAFPQRDQPAIVRKIESFAEETQRLARLYERKLAALEALKKSLLHQAFSGEL